MVPSIFCDRASTPVESDLHVALGPAHALWESLKAGLAAEFGPLVEDWSFAGKSHGWSLRLKHRDRPVLYLTPSAGGFRASLALPERAMPVALAADLSPRIRAIVATAPTYPEGRAVRIEVTSAADVANLVALARVRMAS